MQTMTLNNAVKNFSVLPPQIIDGGEIINIATDAGNIILISEAKYRSMLDPFYSESNMRVLMSSITDMENGIGIVRKTMEELEAMENE